MVKNLHAVQDTWVQSLGWEDPLEKEMAALSSVLAWRMPWTEEPGGPQFIGSQSDTTKRLTLSFFHFMVVLFLVCWRISILFSIVAISVYIPTSSVVSFLFLHILSSIYCLQSFFDDGHSDQSHFCQSRDLEFMPNPRGCNRTNFSTCHKKYAMTT